MGSDEHQRPYPGPSRPRWPLALRLAGIGLIAAEVASRFTGGDVSAELLLAGIALATGREGIEAVKAVLGR